MTVTAGAVVFFLLLSGWQSACATEQDGKQEEPPSREMLEFLGEWETRTGIWFDPTVKEMGPESQQGAQQEQNND